MARDRQALASEAWKLLFDFVTATADHRDRVLERLELTAGDVRTLGYLDAERELSMSELAEAWSCDRSTATWLVDRLERRGLAGRREVAGDRRRRAVVLTPAGAELKRELLESLYAPPPELLELDRQALTRLRDGLRELGSAGERRAPRPSRQMARKP